MKISRGLDFSITSDRVAEKYCPPPVDTPRSENMFGSLVVALPHTFTGGALIVKHDKAKVKFCLGSESEKNVAEMRKKRLATVKMRRRRKIIQRKSMKRNIMRKMNLNAHLVILLKNLLMRIQIRPNKNRNLLIVFIGLHFTQTVNMRSWKSPVAIV